MCLAHFYGISSIAFKALIMAVSSVNVDLVNKAKRSVIYWKIWKNSGTEMLKAFEYLTSLFQQLKLLVQTVLPGPKLIAFHLTLCIILSNFNL